MSLTRRALLAATLVAAMACPPAFAADAENTMIIRLKDGDVRIALRPDLAPKHVARVKELVRAGEYDNVVFHRVIDGFMAQTGDVKFGDAKDGFDANMVGTGRSDRGTIPLEASNTPFKRGTVGMARPGDPNGASSQFFIMFADGDFLNGQYTVFGEVESGMEYVDSIKKGDPSANGVVADPDRMVKVRIAADN